MKISIYGLVWCWSTSGLVWFLPNWFSLVFSPAELSMAGWKVSPVVLSEITISIVFFLYHRINTVKKVCGSLEPKALIGEYSGISSLKLKN
jgi:hypothetical protein